MKLRENDKVTIKGALSFLLFFMVLEFKYIPFQIIGIDINNIPTILQCIYVIIVELIVIISIIILYKDYIIESFNDFKKNKNLFLKKYIKYWFVILIGTALLNIIINSLNNNQIAGNEEAIREMMGQYPIYTWITGVLLAPIIEELSFRLALKSIFKSKWIFIIASGLVFGSFHLFGSVSTIYDLLYILPYSLPGFIFAYILYDSDNIFIPIGLHMLHNGIVMGLQILLLLFGANIL